FLSNVSHELRSPLSAIYQFATILADGLTGEMTPEQQEYLQIIVGNVRQLQSMIDDLLEATRVQSGKLSIEPQCASVSEAMIYTKDIFQKTAEAKSISLSFRIRRAVF